VNTRTINVNVNRSGGSIRITHFVSIVVSIVLC